MGKSRSLAGRMQRWIALMSCTGLPTEQSREDAVNAEREIVYWAARDELSYICATRFASNANYPTA